MKMRPFAFFVAAVAMIAVSQATAQTIGITKNPLKSMWVKSENGLVIAWHRGDSKDAQTSVVSIYDKQGKSLLNVDMLRFVPEAKTVSILDVSAKAQQMVAVSAVYVKATDVPPAAALLYIDFNGALLSADALEPAREIAALALDDDLNVWTLTMSSGGKEPSRVPLVIEYDRKGDTVRELLMRNLFPPHEETIESRPTSGWESAGYSSGTFWFWLPTSTDFVTIRTLDGEVLSRSKTGYPQVPDAKVVPFQVERDGFGTLVAETRVEEAAPKPSARLAYFTWSSETKSWSEFEPGACSRHRLVGTDGGQQIYLGFDKASICAYAR
jgi:hypothetical protein